MKLDVPGLSSRLVLHHSVQPLDLLMGLGGGGNEGGTEGEMEGGEEWHDARSSLPPSFLKSVSSSIRSLLSSIKLLVTTTLGWVRKGRKAGGKAVRAACPAVVESGKNVVSSVFS